MMSIIPLMPSVSYCPKYANECDAVVNISGCPKTETQIIAITASRMKSYL